MTVHSRLLAVCVVASSVLLIRDATAENPVAPQEPPATVAKVTVTQCEPIKLGSGMPWQNVPAYLTDATIYEKAAKPSNQLQLEVLEGGLMVMAASWTYDGNSGGGWQEGRATDKTLVEDGWLPIGQMIRINRDKKPDSHMLYRRLAKKGERIELHTRKYNAPLLILPTSENIAAVLAAKPVAGGAVASSSGTPTPPRQKPVYEYRDEPGTDAVLVGLRVTIDSIEPNRRIGSIQPIYEAAQGRIDGAVHGVPAGSVVEVQAQDGYAVSGIVSSIGTGVVGFRVTFTQRKAGADGKRAFYESRWVGDQTGDSEVKAGNSETNVGGIRGLVGEAVRSIELISAK